MDISVRSNSPLIPAILSWKLLFIVLFSDSPSSSVSAAGEPPNFLPQSSDNADLKSAESLMNHADPVWADTSWLRRRTTAAYAWTAGRIDHKQHEHRSCYQIRVTENNWRRQQGTKHDQQFTVTFDLCCWIWFYKNTWKGSVRGITSQLTPKGSRCFIVTCSSSHSTRIQPGWWEILDDRLGFHPPPLGPAWRAAQSWWSGATTPGRDGARRVPSSLDLLLLVPAVQHVVCSKYGEAHKADSKVIRSFYFYTLEKMCPSNSSNYVFILLWPTSYLDWIKSSQETLGLQCNQLFLLSINLSAFLSMNPFF